MSTQELLTYLFDAIALGFIVVAAMDFTSRLIVLYQQVSMASSSSKKELSNQQSTSGLSSIATPQKLPPLPDPWLLPSSTEEFVVLVKVVQKEQKHLKLLPPAKEIGMAVTPKLEDLLQGISIDKLKLRQARKIAKVLGIAQKVNGRDQKLAFLVSQIKLKLQQAKAEVVEVVQQELLAW